MIMFDLLRRRLERTPGSLFQPIIVRDEKQAEGIWEHLRRHFKVAIGVGFDMAILLALGDRPRELLPKTEVIVGFVRGPLSEADLDACNWGRDRISGAGIPVVWLMTRDQMKQLQGCPDLWSCRGMEIFGDGT